MNLHFITGGAGTGKSYNLRKAMEDDVNPYVICAPTGLAAINVGGMTIHKLFRIDIHGNLLRLPVDSPLYDAETIYIDETSMVSNEIMHSIMARIDQLGGGMKVVAYGDLAQLKPVEGDYFFKAYEPASIEKLEKNYRQAEDLEFAGILNNIRRGVIKAPEVKWINERCLLKEEFTAPVLAFANRSVDAINADRVMAIQEEQKVFTGELKGDFKETECQAPIRLVVKPTMEIILLVNHRQELFQNGTRGTVVRVINDEQIEVQLHDKRKSLVKVSKHVWAKEERCALTESRKQELEEIREHGAYTLFYSEERINRIMRTGIDEKVTGTFKQFPFKPGYASTVHKAQGQTMDAAIIDPDGFGRLHGLAYVALSRLTSVNGLRLTRKLTMLDFKFDKTVLPYV